MTVFKDSTGTDWPLRLTVGMVKRIKDELDIDIVKEYTQNPLKIFGDDEQFVQILYCMCNSDIEKRGLTPEQFGELFDGETLENAAKAWSEEAANFFPRSRGAREKMASLNSMMWAEIDRETQKKLDQIAEKIKTSQGEDSTGSRSAEPSE